MHIVPYPPAVEEFGQSSVDAAHAEQVHNSYFNGIILGYPQRFVETYCKDLPNKLNESQLRRALNAGKDEVASVIQSGLVQKNDLLMRLNRTEGISAAKWDYIKHRVMAM